MDAWRTAGARGRTCTRTRTRTCAHTHARTRTHTHAHAHTHLWDGEMWGQLQGALVQVLQQGLVVPCQHAHRGREGSHLWGTNRHGGAGHCRHQCNASLLHTFAS